ncbi:hypothetical protein GCM10009838_68490 [Catenulispora subtropica]|uniref:Uncharacterized protein n=1 Tax=Catenulispora subtropica TaxID=450798 RepID=A0ABN2SY85_9ACTN
MVVRAVVTIVPSRAIMKAASEVRVRTQRCATVIGGFAGGCVDGFGAVAVLMPMVTARAAGNGRRDRAHFPGRAESVLPRAHPCHP